VKEVQQQLLDNNSMLLEYLLGDERSYLWAVTATELYSFELPARVQIEEEVARFRQLLTVNQPVAGETFQQTQARISNTKAQIMDAGESLGKLVIGPVADKLGTKRLLIVPDGALQYIPFQALTLPGTTSAVTDLSAKHVEERIPLVANHEIVYEPSASVLALVIHENATREQGSGTVAVFANPVFDAEDPRVRRWTPSPDSSKNPGDQLEVKEAFRDVSVEEIGRIPPLPASREEAEAIFSVIPWHSGLRVDGFDASRAMISGIDWSRYRIVHFATHGFVNYQHPEFSGLVLSLVDEKGNPQDGFLRLADIYNLKLPVDLVVLSACNTGLGKEVKGEGLIGLTRGFMYAGAGGVVASLWKVDDDATAELMKHFYDGMFKKGMTPSGALRDAQLRMLQQQRWQGPYYWAAFVIQGQYNQNEMLRPGLNPVWIILLATAISGIAILFFMRRRRRFFNHKIKSPAKLSH
jgi:CHAT domain-containing protein